MSRKPLIALTAMVMAFGIVSCAITEPWDDYIPPAVAMQITAVNKMNAPVTLQLRHAYRGLKDGFKANKRTYSDWITAVLEPGDSQIIGEETAQYRYKNQEETMTGFILLDRSDSNYKEKYGASSSFEMEITMPPGGGYPPVYRLAGYKTVNWDFFREGLGELEIIGSETHVWAILHYKGGTLSIFSVPYLIEAELIIDTDGTLAFNYSNVKNGGLNENGFF